MDPVIVNVWQLLVVSDTTLFASCTPCFNTIDRSYKMDPATAMATAAAVQAVSVKPPASRPDAWFQQTEAQFALRGITDSTTQLVLLPPHSLGSGGRGEDGWRCCINTSRGQYAYLQVKLTEVYGLTDNQTPGPHCTWGFSALCTYPESHSWPEYPSQTEMSKYKWQLHRSGSISSQNWYHHGCQCIQPTSETKEEVCWYHAKFDHRAKSCKPPCFFVEDLGNGQART
jgi:hypothetical protein